MTPLFEATSELDDNKTGKLYEMSWRPAHEEHAIERATLTLNFQEEVPAKALHNAVELVSTSLFSLGFSPSVPPPPNNVFVVNVGPEVSIRQPSDGRAFQIARDGELIEELVFQRGYLSYTTTRYSRWRPVVNRISNLTAPVILKLIEISNVASLKIEYYDRFVFDGQREAANFHAAIKEKSEFVPGFCLAMNDLWHSHTGYFTKSTNEYQRLININVDVLDVVPKHPKPDAPAEARRSVAIYTMAEDRFLVAAQPKPLDDVAAIFAVADEMHVVLKDVLREVISPTLAESISLDQKGA